MIKFLIATCMCLIGLVGQAMAQSILLEPDRLREGDPLTRKITLRSKVAPGASLSIAVSYKTDPTAPASSFIPKFSVRDNGSEDSDPQDGKIRVVLPREFDKTGVYIIETDEPRAVVSLVHEPNNASYFRQFADWLVAAAGGGTRRDTPLTALERIEDLIESKDYDKVAIWIGPLPKAGQEIERQSLKLSIRSALMPAWSRNQNYLACSTWRDGKWILGAYAINPAGVATQLWQWNPKGVGGNDFSPAWSPKGDGVVFVRLDQEKKSDIWILEFDRNRRPKKEIRATTIGNVHAILGWDKDLGILFETQIAVEGQPGLRQIWALKPTVPVVQITPISDAYGLIRGGAPLRGSVLYIQERKTAPRSTIYEETPNGKVTLLREEACLHRWLTVSSDEKWLAFDSNCPR